MRKLHCLVLLLLLLGLRLQAQTFMNFTIQQPAPPVAAFTSTPNGLTTTFAGQNMGGITTWSWNFGDGGTSTLQNPTHTYVNEGPQVACLTVGDQYGCTATTCDSLFLVGLENMPLVQGIAVFPNPLTTETQVVYTLDRFASVKIDVLNMLGQSLQSICNEEQGAGEHSLKLGLNLPAGVYLLRLQADDQRSIIRITSAH
jgi:hypothetical protein